MVNSPGTNWSEWIYINNSFSNSIHLYDAPFPVQNSDSKSFWIKSLIETCTFPWLTAYNPLDMFFGGGGGSPSVNAAIDAIQNVNDILSLDISGKFGYGYNSPYPEDGYCIGNQFKQHAYTSLYVENDLNTSSAVAFGNPSIVQNSKLKRVFVYCGEITSYNVDTGALKLDIENNIKFYYPDKLKGFKIEIYSSEQKKTFIINNIDTDGTIYITNDDSDFIIKRGCFYKFNKAINVCDPLLLSGKWVGSENQSSDYIDQNNSDQDFFITDHNIFYLQTVIIGVYLPLESSEPATASTFDIGEPIDFSAKTWAYIPTIDTVESLPASNKNVGYAYVKNDTYDENVDGALKWKIVELTSVGKSVLNESINKLNCIRIGTDSSALSSRHNFYAPCLKNSYIKQGNSFFKILAHVSATIVDIAKIAVDGKTLFNPLSNDEIYIYTNYGWIINEHYESNMTQNTTHEFLKGTIIDNENNKIIYLKPENIEYTTLYGKNVIDYETGQKSDSFFNRFLYELKHDITQPTKQYRKFNGYKLASGTNIYDIESIEVQNKDDIGIFKIMLSGSASNLSNSASVFFDSPFAMYNGYGKNAFYEVTGTNKADKNSLYNFVVSNALCLNGGLYPNPYNVTIPSESRIGFCRGRYFGFDFNGTAQSPYSSALYISVVKLSLGLSAFYNNLANKDNVIFSDFCTGVLNIRNGAINFRLNPQKFEISYGDRVNEKMTGSNEFVLNTKYERLRALKSDLPVSDKNNGYFIYLDSSIYKGVYGTLINGSGDTSLPVDIENNNTAIVKQGEQKISPIYGLLPTKDMCNNNSKIECFYNVSLPIQGSSTIKFIGENDSQFEINDLYAQYIANNNIIDSNYNESFSAGIINDGTFILLYDMKFDSLYIEEHNYKLLNNSIFIIGSSDGETWGTPCLNNTVLENRYPIMLAPGCNLITAFISNKYYFNTIEMVIQTTTSDNSDTIFYYSFNLNSLLQQAVLIKDKNNYFSFYLRPFAIEDTTWINKQNKINVQIDLNKKYIPDSICKLFKNNIFINQSDKSDYVCDLRLAFLNILGDGKRILLFKIISNSGNIFQSKTNSGIGAIISSSYSGASSTWQQTNFIYASNADCAIMVGRYLVYISNNKIYIKNTSYIDFFVGNIDNKEEILKYQLRLDSISVGLVSGDIEVQPQKLSGYVDPAGIMHIYCYDSEGKLTLFVNSSDVTNNNFWKVSDNF